MSQIRIGPQAGFQEDFLRAPEFEVLGGGVAGSGKSIALLLDFLQDVKEYGAEWQGMIIRKHLPDLNSLIKEGKRLFRPFGAIYKEVKHQFEFPNGAALECRFMEDPRDWERYQGSNLCVAKGTLILMASGAYRKIQDISVGDLVMTLEGPKPVLALMPPRLAECVRAEVYAWSHVLEGVQYHPVSHPVLTNALVPAGESCRSYRNVQRLIPFGIPHWSSYESLLCAHREKTTSSYKSKDGGNCDVASYEPHQESQRPLSLSCPVILARPESRLGCSQSSALWYVHPYTGKHRRVTLQNLYEGSCVLTPCGDMEVYDLTVKDANHYISKVGKFNIINQNTWIGWDEVCQQDTADNYIKMIARVRNHPRARVRATGQPGTPGASWVKDYFKIGQFPHGRKIIARIVKNERTGEEFTLTRMFLPGKLAENKILLKRDPGYEVRLQNLPQALRKAWYEGSWDIFFGQRFSWFPQYHIIKNGPWPPPDTAQIFMAFDRGFGAPFSVGWYWTGEQGEIYRAREWYGWNGTKNQGLRLPPSEIAEGIIARERRWGIWGKVSYRAAGREVFSGSVNEISGIQGPSWNEIFIGVDPALSFTKVKDDRRKDGFSQIDERLKLTFDKETSKLVKPPGIRIYEECDQFLRIFPDVVAARNDPEEIDCDEDHVVEELVRGLMSRPLAMQDRIPVKSEVEKLVEQIDADSYYDDEKFSNYGEGEGFPY